MQGWTELFRRHILDRGESYFDEGAVIELKKTPDGYYAVVEGTEDYEVEIETEGDEIVEMYCTCPYADDGNYCKHMAAVLYKIDEENGKDIPEKENWLEIHAKETEEIEGIVERIPEEELRTFVKRLARSDREIKSMLLTSYALQIDIKQMNRLRQKVDDIIYRFGGRNRYIDYRNAWDFTNALEGFLYDKVQILIERNCNIQAFEMTNYVFKKLNGIDIDDSEGGITQIANTCYEMWKRILHNSSEEDRNKMYDWFRKNQGNSYVNDYLQDYIDDFLVDEFHDPEMLQEKLESLDRIIEQQENSVESGGMWSSHYGYRNNILRRLGIMEELGCSDEEIKEYRKANWKFSEIRKLDIQENIEKGNIGRAVAVLKESKKLDRDYQGLVADYSAQLISIYEKQGDIEAYKNELLFCIFTCGQYDLLYTNKLKKVCTENEWIDYREKILSSRSRDMFCYSLMESEGLHERLLKCIGARGSLFVLDQYEKVLKKQFPEQVRDIYILFLSEQAERASDRNRYRQLMHYLKKIKTYPGGKEKAAEIAKNWRASYYRRKAMMDEMRKAGF